MDCSVSFGVEMALLYKVNGPPLMIYVRTYIVVPRHRHEFNHPVEVQLGLCV